MNPRPLPVAALVATALLLGAARADAATFLGSPDSSATPTAFACDACPAGTSMGFRQFSLRTATVETPESGVLVSAGVYAKRISGSEDPRIAVLRPDDDGVALRVVDSAPLPVIDSDGALTRREDLHLELERGDSIGFLFRAGEVDLGVRERPRPDGAIQWFNTPCDPCGMDGGTGVELLFDATVEPDVDGDARGDETQDADGGGLGMDWVDDWFEDFDNGDQLDEDFTEDFGPDEERAASRRRPPRTLGLIAIQRLRGGRAAALLRVPKAGRVNVSVTLPANRRTGAGPFTTVLIGDMRVKRAGRVRVMLDSTVAGTQAMTKRKKMRTKVVVAYFPRKTTLELLMRSARI